MVMVRLRVRSTFRRVDIPANVVSSYCKSVGKFCRKTSRNSSNSKLDLKLDSTKFEIRFLVGE